MSEATIYDIHRMLLTSTKLKQTIPTCKIQNRKDESVQKNGQIPELHLHQRPSNYRPRCIQRFHQLG